MYAESFLANKLATYQRGDWKNLTSNIVCSYTETRQLCRFVGPHEAPLLRGTSLTKQWCESAAPLQPSSWLVQATQPDTDGEQHLEGAPSVCCVERRLPITLTVGSKVNALLQAPAAMPVLIKLPSTCHCTLGMLLVTPWGKLIQKWRTKLLALQQQTLALHANWQQEQAAAHACKPILCA